MSPTAHLSWVRNTRVSQDPQPHAPTGTSAARTEELLSPHWWGTVGRFGRRGRRGFFFVPPLVGGPSAASAGEGGVRRSRTRVETCRGSLRWGLVLVGTAPQQAEADPPRPRRLGRSPQGGTHPVRQAEADPLRPRKLGRSPHSCGD